ncbi:TetR/AcrR family transcriptional regulator [Brevibacterium sp. 239c]|uniref:TetR/AcrR family transcriptional regulator n=1 Tax=Brevibacterium sp. 239c TaxID=1965356 RepID=UPI0011AFC288|nr:TetR family transcriptional regulator [Brevibacterium sp. 239c]
MTEGKVGRPARLDRVGIARAAIALADRTSLPQVTMRALAAEIGSAPAALYRHVDDRNGLVALMIDEVLAERTAVEAKGSWRADLSIFAAGIFALHRAHPWLSTGALPGTMGPGIAEVMDETIGLLASHPAPAGRKYSAIAVLLELVAGHARTAARLEESAAVIVEDAGRSGSVYEAGHGADEDYATAVIIAAVGGILNSEDL